MKYFSLTILAALLTMSHAFAAPGVMSLQASPVITGLFTLPTVDGTNGQVLTTNGAGILSWSAGGGGGGSGTVTSVAATVPSFLTISGSPITTSGTLAFDLATQSANTVFAGPTTGGAAAPAFRSLVAADVPTLNQNTTGTAANITAASNSTLTTLSALSLPGSQVSGDISGNAANVTGTVAIANGGTGQVTANAALNAFLPSQSSNTGKILSTDGTNTSWVTPTALSSNTLMISYTAASIVVNNGATVLYDTVVFDNSAGAYNTSTGEFTAPTTGFYLAGWSGTSIARNTAYNLVVTGVGGGTASNIYSQGATAADQGYTPLYLTAGDVVKVINGTGISEQMSAIPSDNRFQILRIGNSTNTGATIALDNLASTAVNVDILPVSSATKNLGSASFLWNKMFMKSIVNDASVETTSIAAGASSTLAASTVVATAIGANYQWADFSYTGYDLYYTMVESTTGHVKRGRISINQDPLLNTEVDITDDGFVADPAFPVVTFSAASTGGNLVISYTNAGTNNVSLRVREIKLTP